MDLSEERKIIKAAVKDKKQFELLYKENYEKILSFFRKRVDEEYTAEELTSTVFEKCLKALDNYRWQGLPFSSWLFRISRNVLIDFYRINSKKNKVEINNEYIENHQDKITPETIFEDNYVSSYLGKLLNELPPREREVIYMKFYDGYKNKLISEVTGLSETNVGTIIYRAVKKIRSMYKM